MYVNQPTPRATRTGHMFTYAFGFAVCYVYYQMRDHGSVLGQVALPPKKYTTALPAHLARERGERRARRIEIKAQKSASAKMTALQAKEGNNANPNAAVTSNKAGEDTSTAAVPDARFQMRKAMTQPKLMTQQKSSTALNVERGTPQRRRTLSALRSSNSVVPHGDTADSATDAPSDAGRRKSEKEHSRSPESRQEAIQRLLDSGVNVRQTNSRRLPKLASGTAAPPAAGSSSKLRSAFSTSTLGSVHSLKQVHVADSPRKLNAWIEGSDADLTAGASGSTSKLETQPSNDSIFGSVLLNGEGGVAGGAKAGSKAGGDGVSDRMTKPEGSQKGERVGDDTTRTAEKGGVAEHGDTEGDDILDSLLVPPPGFLHDDDDDNDSFA
jgi:hypothetical protein